MHPGRIAKIILPGCSYTDQFNAYLIVKSNNRNISENLRSQNLSKAGPHKIAVWTGFVIEPMQQASKHLRELLSFAASNGELTRIEIRND